MIKKSIFKIKIAEICMATLIVVSLAITQSKEVKAACTPVTFPDANLEAAIRATPEVPDTGDICAEDLATITSLDASGRGISNLEGMQYLTSLQALYLQVNQITSLTALANLTGLKVLSLEFNQITSLTALANLTSLQTLYLGHNQIINLTGLENLTSLQTLYLLANQITSLTALANLTSLKTLSIENNQIINLTGLENLTSLQALYLQVNQITSLTALANLTGLQTLYLNYNYLSINSACSASNETLDIINTFQGKGCYVNYSSQSEKVCNDACDNDENSLIDCEDPSCSDACGEQAVPEFTIITAVIAAVAGFGIFFVIKQKKQKATVK
jgi:Leucine-rich repeat (LRR) protein